ncbi:MAG: hypothetical protein KAJ07_08735 [Planctomycetes bacterium]|nr:hypothetical protein [Planctomycetota bacterium]
MICKTDRQHRRGFIALVVLIGIAIVAVLYFTQVSSFVSVSVPPGSKGGNYRKPWHDEDRLLGPDAVIELPKRPKLELNEAFVLEAEVSRDGQDRGAMTLEFLDDGRVNGSWYCSYSHDRKHYTCDAAFSGNIDVDVVYRNDQRKKDKTQLYFITKGNYAKETYAESTDDSSIENGIVYVTGFIKPDHSASGKLTITTDKQWSAQYQWQCKANEN